MTTYTSLLPKTGQTTSYVTGDDGDLEKGAARSFTVLNTGQYSGTTEITLAGASENHTNNCVLDNVTGLMWQKAIAGTIGADDGKGGRTNYFPWTTNGSGIGLWTYLAAANAANLSGHNDWRIPNILEGRSIINGETGYAFSEFTDAPQFWSSSSVSITGAYYINSFGGSSFAKTDVYFVLLVRGDPQAPAGGGGSLIGGNIS